LIPSSWGEMIGVFHYSNGDGVFFLGVGGYNKKTD